MEVRKDSPFGQGEDWNLNACVGTNGGPYNYADYGRGYFQTGDLIATYLLSNRGVSIDLPLDIAIYPLLYMYRQGTELLMKHFIYDKKNPPKNDRKHDLLHLWGNSRQEIVELFSEVFTAEDMEELLNKLEIFITKMHELDPRGEVTRFPEDPSGNLFLQEYSIINIEPICKSANEVLGIFEYFITAAEDLSFSRGIS